MRRESAPLAAALLALFVACWLWVEGRAIAGRGAYVTAALTYTTRPFVAFRVACTLLAVIGVIACTVARSKDATASRNERWTFAAFAVSVCALLVIDVSFFLHNISDTVSAALVYENIRASLRTLRGVLIAVTALTTVNVFGAWAMMLSSRIANSTVARALGIALWFGFWAAGLNLLTHYVGGVALLGVPA